MTLNVFITLTEKTTSLNSNECEVLIDLTSHNKIEFAFQNQILLCFWYKLIPNFSFRKLNVLLSFSMTFFCNLQSHQNEIQKTFLIREHKFACNYQHVNRLLHQKTLQNKSTTGFTLNGITINVKSVVRQIY